MVLALEALKLVMMIAVPYIFSFGQNELIPNFFSIYSFNFEFTDFQDRPV